MRSFKLSTAISFILPFISLVLLPTSRAEAEISADNNHAEALVEWVRSKGGFFSEKLEIRRMDRNDELSPYGVFAKEDIDTEERLIEVPHQCYITLSGDEIEIIETVENYWENLRRLAQKLMKEMRLDEKESNYGPYIAYLKTQKRGQLPATWSKAGKDLLRKVLGPGESKAYGNHVLPPREAVDWIDENFVKTGLISEDDPFEEHCVEMVVQRGYDTALIPIWDMVNHDNYRINTNNTSLHSDGGIKVWATGKIEAGEEIYATYNRCTDCGETEDIWGTPELLRDFGFVESYPQTWIFEEHKLFITAYEEEDDEVDSDFYIDTWYQFPDDAALVFLREQYRRLKAMEDNEMADPGTVPKHEWDVINLFYWAAIDVIDGAIAAVEDKKEEL